MAKQIKVRDDNYFAVQGWMVTELKLKGTESSIMYLEILRCLLLMFVWIWSLEV